MSLFRQQDGSSVASGVEVRRAAAAAAAGIEWSRTGSAVTTGG